MTQQLEIKIVPRQNDINIFTAHFCPPIKFSTFHLDPKSDDFQEWVSKSHKSGIEMEKRTEKW